MSKLRDVVWGVLDVRSGSLSKSLRRSADKDSSNPHLSSLPFFPPTLLRSHSESRQQDLELRFRSDQLSFLLWSSAFHIGIDRTPNLSHAPYPAPPRTARTSEG